MKKKPVVAFALAACALAVGLVEKWKIGLLMALGALEPAPLGPDGRLRFVDHEDTGYRRANFDLEPPRLSYAKIPTQGISVIPIGDDIGVIFGGVIGAIRKADDQASAAALRFKIGHLGAFTVESINAKILAMKTAVAKVAARRFGFSGSFHAMPASA